MREKPREGEMEGRRRIPERVKCLSCQGPVMPILHSRVSKVIYPTKATGSKPPEREKEPRKSQIVLKSIRQTRWKGLEFGAQKGLRSPNPSRGAAFPEPGDSSPSRSALFSGVPERWPEGQMSAWGQGCQKGWEVTGRFDPPGCLPLVGHEVGGGW